MASENEQAAEPVLLTVDPEHDDNDSALGKSVAGSYTASLTSTVLNFQYENGRRYHGYREGSYILPNDEPEQDRLDMFHHIYRMINGGDLYCAPITERALSRVIDLGTGTGIWAIDFADEFPASLVIGNDLSPIQPTWVPPNCEFYVEDIESQWTYSPEEWFDYIHGRALTGSVGDFKRLFRQAFENLNPGGWFELQDFDNKICSDDGTLELVKDWANFVEQLQDASERHGKPLGVNPQTRSWIEEAGFVNVRHKMFKVPIGPWAKDKIYKYMGLFNLALVLDSIEPVTLALFTRVLSYSAEEASIIIANVKNDLRKREAHIWVPAHFFWGQKPE